MRHLLFPTLVLESSICRANSQLNTELLKECYKFSELDSAGQSWSKKNYPKGYTSYASMNNMYDHSPYFLELRQKIDRVVVKYIQDLEMDIKAKELQMTSLWMNIMPQGVTHSMHIHPLSVISGTYYVQIPSGSSLLKLEDPRLLGHMASPPRKPKAKPQNQRFIYMQPKVGSVLLFESWLRHEVPPNLAKQDRVSISFNYDWCR